ncbi:MAG TPA: glutamine--fructose-6-phosphate transaminase (isomerizing) [Patescibacteria group bacterium]|nr:glutamine--fructose-6-phosphate transaminase (isomerizing) [Patescibacteria group bacterium]
MCGIVAYQGPHNASPRILEGLKLLEYRGYDSWGLAVMTDKGMIHCKRQTGEIAKVSLRQLELPKSSSGIGHTRWATHGGVTVKNAHPHFSMNKKVVLVQNGIVENYIELKKNLERKGYMFFSETDTEVIANQIEEYRKRYTLKESVRRAMKDLEGRNAIVVMEEGSREIIAARNGSPLIVGVAPHEVFVASDIPAFIQYTNTVYYLDDGQMASIKEGNVAFFSTVNGSKVNRRKITVDIQAKDAEKGSYAHYMIKEIMEQKDTTRRAVEQDEQQLKKVASMIHQAYGSFLVGCGSAAAVCKLGEYLFAKIGNRHINAVEASEFKHFSTFLTPKSLMIIVSQSGETADVIEAIEQAKKKKVKVIGILNNTNSTIGRLADYVFPIHAGPERAVASTKAITAQYAVMTLLAYAVRGDIAEGKRRLVEVAGQMNELLNPRYGQYVKKIAKLLVKHEHVYILGRGVNVPIAKESSIKLQEISYIHAESFAAGELKHGPLALISKKTPVIVLTGNDDDMYDILSNAKEVQARGGVIIGIGPQKHEVFDYWLHVPDVGEFSYMVNVLPIQLLAYNLGVMKGNNPDKPRNLAKSVTVK